MMKKASLQLLISLVFLPFWWALALPSAVNAAGFENSVVSVLINTQPVDLESPWKKKKVSSIKHLGTFIGDGRILMTAYGILDATLIEMRRFGSAEKFPMKVRFADYEANLAILEPLELEALKGMSPIPLGEDLGIDSIAGIVKERDVFQVLHVPARLVQVGVLSSSTSDYSLATYQFEVRRKNMGWSEPIISERGQLVGLTTGQDDGFVYGLPASIIKHFLEDSHDHAYRGFPSAWISARPLTDPNLRRMIGGSQYAHGVRVKTVLPNSPFADKLQENDIILKVDGTQISEYGTYPHPLWGKIAFSHLIVQKYPGDDLNLDILRAGKPLKIQAPLQRFDSNRMKVPYGRYGLTPEERREPHLIFGGLVFQELSQGFLRLWRSEWRKAAPMPLLHEWLYTERVSENSEERSIILNYVLADQFNRGYEKIGNRVVEAVNGKEVKSIADLRKALGKPLKRNGKNYTVVSLKRGGGDLVIGYSGLQKAHKRIAKNYGITNATSFWTQ